MLGIENGENESAPHSYGRASWVDTVVTSGRGMAREGGGRLGWGLTRVYGRCRWRRAIAPFF